MIIGIGGANTLFQYTAPLGYGACGYTQTSVQADGGGAATSSYLSGVINQGEASGSRPMRALLQLWAWGISAAIDEFACRPES